MLHSRCYIDYCSFTPRPDVLTNPTSVSSLVWTDYRLALLIAVFIPLTLLIWSLVKKAEAISALMTIYWRVASLLAISIYLMMAGWSVGFATTLLAKILVPVSLWFWADLNEEIREQPKRSLNLGFNAWRWAMSAYCLVSGIFQLLFIRCAFAGSLIDGSVCQAWLQPALGYKDAIHGEGFKPTFLAILGATALAIYALYLAYFLLVRLSRQGRSALNQ